MESGSGFQNPDPGIQVRIRIRIKAYTDPKQWQQHRNKHANIYNKVKAQGIYVAMAENEANASAWDYKYAKSTTDQRLVFWTGLWEKTLGLPQV